MKTKCPLDSGASELKCTALLYLIRYAALCINVLIDSKKLPYKY